MGATASDPLGWLGAVLESKYRIDAFVGSGGFGYVYRGTHLRLAKPIAVKFLRPELAVGHESQRKFLARFLAEGRILHDLSRATAGVVQALDLGAASSPTGVWTPFLVMEWIEGPTLADALRVRPRRSVAEALALLEPLIIALETAHELGIAHLDLKPTNVMIARIGTRDTMKVLDFGIAKVMGAAEEEGTAGKTGMGTRLFTPGYGAPEQFEPSIEATGPWTDVYALGLMLLEIVDGERAYTTDDALVCRKRALDLETRPTLRSDRSLDPLLRRILAVDPRNRPRSAAELRRELSARGTSPPSSKATTEIGSTGASSVSTSPPRRRFRWGWVAGAAGLVLGGIVGVATYVGIVDGRAVEASPMASVSWTAPVPPSRELRAREAFVRWEHAQRDRNPHAIAATFAEPSCFYGGRRTREAIGAALTDVYAKNPSFAQATKLSTVRVVLSDASDHVRVEFDKTFTMDGTHRTVTKGYLVLNGDGNVITESDELSDKNLLAQGGGERECRVGKPW